MGVTSVCTFMYCVSWRSLHIITVVAVNCVKPLTKLLQTEWHMTQHQSAGWVSNAHCWAVGAFKSVPIELGHSPATNYWTVAHHWTCPCIGGVIS